MSVTPADFVALAVAGCRIREICVCPETVNLFMEILANVSYALDTTAIVKARISQVFSQTLENEEYDLSLRRACELQSERQSD